MGRSEMTTDRNRKCQEMASRGKYNRLYRHLCNLPSREWRTTFREIESIMGFELPASARLHRPWWANQRGSSGHSQALAWSVAGWETAEVDMDAETLLLRPQKARAVTSRFSLDQILPVHSAGGWPGDLSLRREDIYEERI